MRKSYSDRCTCIKTHTASSFTLWRSPEVNTRSSNELTMHISYFLISRRNDLVAHWAQDDPYYKGPKWWNAQKNNGACRGTQKPSQHRPSGEVLNSLWGSLWPSIYCLISPLYAYCPSPTLISSLCTGRHFKAIKIKATTPHQISFPVCTIQWWYLPDSVFIMVVKEWFMLSPLLFSIFPVISQHSTVVTALSLTSSNFIYYWDEFMASYYPTFSKNLLSFNMLLMKIATSD